MNPWLEYGVWKYARVLPEHIAIDAIARFTALEWGHYIEPYDKLAPNWIYVRFNKLADPLSGAECPPMPTIDVSSYYTPAKAA